MVSGASLAIPFMVVIALWFVSTGVVAMISHRLRSAFGQSLLIACVCAFLGLGLVAFSSQSGAVWASYTSFLGGLLIWSWHEISFLTGAVTGSRPLPPESDRLATLFARHHGADSS
jgi:putative photosynthetic complex assembly protein 2